MKNKTHIHPYSIIIISFVGVILGGTIALVLPIAASSGRSIGVVNALFLSTSATCVTGLTPIAIATELSAFGKVIMALLMEIGGLSFITIGTFFFVVMGGHIGVFQRFMLRESLNQLSAGGLQGLIKKIMAIAFSVQLTGWIVNIYPFYETYGNMGKAIGVSAFHAVAAFNNAGFDIVGDSSLIPFAGSVYLNVTTMLLIVIGSTGFIVIDEVLRKRQWKKLSLHSKLALTTTAFLLIGGTLFIKLTMQDPAFTWLQSAFTSVTTRTAGFTVYNLHNLKGSPGAYAIILVLMMIGASPSSTGGGVKTTTFAVIFLTIVYFAQGKKAKAFKRSIGESQIFKAFVLMNVAMIIVVISAILVSVFQPQLAGTLFADGTAVGFEDILFEVISAFSTTGLSMGITGMLNPANRVFLCLIMFAGRLGPLTIIGVLNRNWMTGGSEKIKYVEEGVIIG